MRIVRTDSSDIFDSFAEVMQKFNDKRSHDIVKTARLAWVRSTLGLADEAAAAGSVLARFGDDAGADFIAKVNSKLEIFEGGRLTTSASLDTVANKIADAASLKPKVAAELAFEFMRKLGKSAEMNALFKPGGELYNAGVRSFTGKKRDLLTLQLSYGTSGRMGDALRSTIASRNLGTSNERFWLREHGVTEAQHRELMVKALEDQTDFRTVYAQHATNTFDPPLPPIMPNSTDLVDWRTARQLDDPTVTPPRPAEAEPTTPRPAEAEPTTPRAPEPEAPSRGPDVSTNPDVAGARATVDDADAAVRTANEALNSGVTEAQASAFANTTVRARATLEVELDTVTRASARGAKPTLPRELEALGYSVKKRGNVWAIYHNEVHISKTLITKVNTLTRQRSEAISNLGVAQAAHAEALARAEAAWLTTAEAEARATAAAAAAAAAEARVSGATANAAAAEARAAAAEARADAHATALIDAEKRAAAAEGHLDGMREARRSSGDPAEAAEAGAERAYLNMGDVRARSGDVTGGDINLTFGRNALDDLADGPMPPRGHGEGGTPPRDPGGGTPPPTGPRKPAADGQSWLRRHWKGVAIGAATLAVAYKNRDYLMGLFGADGSGNPDADGDGEVDPITQEEALDLPEGEEHKENSVAALDGLGIQVLIEQAMAELSMVTFANGSDGFRNVDALYTRLEAGREACIEIRKKDSSTWGREHMRLSALGGWLADYLENKSEGALGDVVDATSRNSLADAHITLEELTRLLGTYVLEEAEQRRQLVIDVNEAARVNAGGRRDPGQHGTGGYLGGGTQEAITFRSIHRGEEIFPIGGPEGPISVRLVDGTTFDGFAIATPLRRGEDINDLRERIMDSIPALIEALESEDGYMLYMRYRNLSEVASLIFNTGAYNSKHRLDNLAEGRALRSMRGGRGTRSRRQYLTRSQKRERRLREKRLREEARMADPEGYGPLGGRRRRRNIRRIRDSLSGEGDLALDGGIESSASKHRTLPLKNNENDHDSINNKDLAMKISNEFNTNRQKRVKVLEKIADEFSNSYFKDAKKGLSGGDEYMKSYYAGLGGMYDESMGKRDADFSQLYDVSDETGVDLVHSAHPKAIMVADAKGRGGLVENGFEQKRHTHSVALSAPSGNYRANYAWIAEQFKKRG